MKLRYTLRAAEGLDHVLSHIDKRSPQGARHVEARMRGDNRPHCVASSAGRLTSNRRLRRVVVHAYPDLIFYSATDAEVVTHGVRHTARRPSSMPE